MINPNRATSEDVLRRLKEASYERMRNELKCSVELLLKDYDMTWDDLGDLAGLGRASNRGHQAKYNVAWGNMSLKQLNFLAHIFSCEPYIIFRPREPWTKT